MADKKQKKPRGARHVQLTPGVREMTSASFRDGVPSISDPGLDRTLSSVRPLCTASVLEEPTPLGYLPP
jgi:hypothetical protein